MSLPSSMVSYILQLTFLEPNKLIHDNLENEMCNSVILYVDLRSLVYRLYIYTWAPKQGG